VVTYLDNILVYSKKEVEYMEYIRKVLIRLREAGLLLKPEKCEFYKKQVPFLGFILSDQGI
jgi:hypothetical protein